MSVTALNVLALAAVTVGAAVLLVYFFGPRK
jgi:hypothetical protein